MARRRVAVLISGRGSNLKALLDACAEPAFPAAIVRVIASDPTAGGMAHAAAAGVPAAVVDRAAFADRAGFEAALQAELEAAEAELVCLAGFMVLLSAGFVGRWTDRLLNIHPSLLPAFRGLDTHARALAAGVRFAGCTVHFVRPAMDDGPIILQAVVPVAPDDDAAGLAARVLAAEHRCYPLALRWVAEGRARVEDGRVVLAGVVAPEGVLVGPQEGPTSGPKPLVKRSSEL